MKNNTKVALMTKTAMFTAIITLVTAFLLHIPLGNGYVHLGDVFIYLAACTLPLPYAIFAASVGAALADGITGAAIWVIPTLIIKGLMVLPFTNKESTFLCKRNIIASFIAGLTCAICYGLAQVIIFKSWALFFFPNPWIQSAVSIPMFLVLAKVFDKLGIKSRLMGEGVKAEI